MPQTRVLTDGIHRKIVAAVAALLLIFTLVIALPVAVPGIATTANAQTTGAPCGVDVLFILDESGSMGRDGNAGINSVRAGFTSFVNELATSGTDSRIGVVEFDTTARKPFANDWKNVAGADATDLINYINSGYAPGVWTNWEDALIKANEFTDANVDKPDFVVMITDGNPTTFVNAPGGFDPLPPDSHENPADELYMYEFGTVAAEDDYASLAGKVAGTGTIIGFGAGSDFVSGGATAARLDRVVDDVTVVSPLANLAEEIADLAEELCLPRIGIDKTGSTSSISAPGTIAYDFVITNLGRTTLNGVTLTDDMLSDESCDWATSTTDPVTGIGVLSPGETVACTGSFAANQGHIDAGTDLVNTAFANSNETDPVSDSWTVSVSQDPSIDLVKSGTLDTGGDGVATPGDIINYTFTVTNTGNTTLTDITVEDVVSGVTVTGTTIASLAPGASNNTAYTGTYAITQTDIDAGLFDNTAQACDDSQLCDEDDERVPIPNTPSLDIDKVTNGSDGPNISAGDPVTWTYTVTNNSNVTLTDIVVTDSQGEIPVYQSGDTGSVGIMDPGEVWIYEATGIATEGLYQNIGYADAEFDGEPIPQASDPSSYTGVGGALAIEKTVWDGDAFVDVAFLPSSTTFPTTVQWQIVVTNSSDWQVIDVVLGDVNAPACVTAFNTAINDLNGNNILNSGQSVSVTCSGEVPSVPYLNTASVVGNDVTGTPVPEVDDDAGVGQVQASGVIGDTVWYDCVGDDPQAAGCDNGVQDAGEDGIVGAKITITGLEGQDVDPVTAGVQTTLTMLTGADGKYLFSGLPHGTYKVETKTSDIPNPGENGLRFTTVASFTIDLAEGGENLTADFGVIADTLPETGLSTDSLLLIAVLLMVAGSLAVLMARRGGDEQGFPTAA